MIPLEPISGLVGLAVGVFTKIHLAKVENRKLELMGAEAYRKDIQAARDSSKGNKEIQWTKRMIAFTLVVTYALLHLGVNLPELLHLTGSTHIGYTEVVPKFLFFGSKEAVQWHEVSGGVITPSLSNAVWGLIGYYFGSGGTRK